ncbi:hypothetical protein PEPNEM18_00217 [Aedoeadaptatus nemausensis]|uniref:DUF2325 domain-containing protein n=1 Tax=Aedoeadaptatus nemausensis TaxID=2582829 RepID=A0A6V6XZ03_9FIRM|nr:hypothetical protein [Peptoniphilus nemausensis]CAC9924225.1 hypothetical protein PEPNEM18_00217 [Peptoniphilus nemausensis]
MNKDYMVNDIKNEMKACIDNMTEFNMFERRPRLEKWLDLLELLYDVEVETEESIMEPESDLEGNENYVGRVHLKLGGGTLGEERVFIPEKVLRLQNISEGDEVRATVVKRVYNNNHLKNIYSYELLEKATETVESERRVISYARVLSDGDYRSLYIEGEGDDGTLRIDLEDGTLGNLNVDEGDIVDYAYWQRDPSAGRVIWIHNIDGDNVLTPFDNMGETVEEHPERFLENIRLTVFGKGESVSDHVRAMTESGGDVVHIEEASEDDIESRMDGADLVLVYLNSVRPAEVKRIRDGVRRRNAEVLFIQDDDINNIFSAIRDKLEDGYYYDL